jgi:hypothetical protein
MVEAEAAICEIKVARLRWDSEFAPSYSHKSMKRSWRWYVRVATSVIGFLGCALLIALWARSYWWLDYRLCEINSKSGIFVHSQQGQVQLMVVRSPSWDFAALDWSKKESALPVLFRETFALPNSPHRNPPQWSARLSVLREFGWTRYSDGLRVIVPHWCLATVLGAVAVAPWIRRFRLRSLLIGLTMVAALFGSATLSD